MTENNNVILIADKTDNSHLWSPKELFLDCIRRMSEEFPELKKVMVIFYNEDNPDYRKRISWSQCGMLRGELITLLSLTKDDLILDMFDDISG